jgi:hypothetical protein
MSSFLLNRVGFKYFIKSYQHACDRKKKSISVHKDYAYDGMFKSNIENI